VVLVGPAADEGVHAERVGAHVEPDGRLQLALARKREREHAVVDLLVLDLGGPEVLADHLARVVAHTDSRSSAWARP